MKKTLIIERLLLFNEFSPLITIFDTFLQSSLPLILQFLKNAKSQLSINEISIISQTICDYIIPLFYLDNEKIKKKKLTTIINNIQELCSKYETHQKFIIVIDSIDVFNVTNKQNIFDIIISISSLQISKSLIQIYHSSIPLLNSYPTYLPLPSDLLSYISTTIISVHSLSHELANQNAKNRAITTPIENNSFEGIIIPLDSNDESRVFISTKHRHKSGKYIYENSVLTIKTNTIISINDIEDFKKTNYIIKKEIENINANFTLTLTNKQKKQKENVILPHFKSQTINYPESSIYYSPDPEDDLDEEDPDNDLLL
ncbi:hypothetical protein PCK1_000801 [Pneumocystis canis]|nr:hypothetical protein PCK1_000801 [Pneumocystis canis]